jgi:hypothetical protein
MLYYRSKKRALIDLVDKLDSLSPLHPQRPRLVRMICDLAHEVFSAGNLSGSGQSSSTPRWYLAYTAERRDDAKPGASPDCDQLTNCYRTDAPPGT